jgi:hypothetical protein
LLYPKDTRFEPVYFRNALACTSIVIPQIKMVTFFREKNVDMNVFEAKPASSSSIGEELNFRLTIKSRQSNGLLSLILFSVLCLTGCSTLKVGGEPVAEPFPAPVAAGEPEPEPVAMAMPAPPPEPSAAPAPAPVIHEDQVESSSASKLSSPTLISGSAQSINTDFSSSIPPTKSNKSYKSSMKPIAESLNPDLSLNKENFTHEKIIAIMLVTPTFNISSSGKMRVYIGNKKGEPPIESMNFKKLQLIEENPKAVKITPRAYGLETNPSESRCYKITSNSPDRQYMLIAKQETGLSVGVNLDFYTSEDCNGASISKSLDSVDVTVTSNWPGKAKRKLYEFIDTTWKAFLGFWENLLGVIFAFLLFLARKSILQKFGFDGKVKLEIN